MSDSLGCLDSLEGAWRQGSARGMRSRERASLLESCCVLRARLQLVVLMYVKAHAGNSINAYADAAAKTHLQSEHGSFLAEDVAEAVRSRPCVYLRRVREGEEPSSEEEGERGQTSLANNPSDYFGMVG